MLDLDGAAAGEALRVLEHEAARGDRPGVDADVALDDDLGGGLLAGRHEGDGRGGEEGESELGHFDELVSADGVGVRADRVFEALVGLRGAARGAESLKALFGSERSRGPRRGCRGANAHARGSLRARAAAMSQLAAAEIS